MIFISKFFNKFSVNIKDLEEKADDILELHDDYRLLRVEGKAIYVDDAKGKIVLKEKDTLPKSPARAAIEAIKKLKEKFGDKKEGKKNIWTCGFRENEERWVWYHNNQPKMTIAFKEAFKDDNLENKFVFQSIKYGMDIIEKIKTEGIEKTAKEIKALVLENSYTKLKCNSCNNEDNYTIDDIVDENKQAKYDSNFVVCSNCENLIKLV